MSDPSSRDAEQTYTFDDHDEIDVQLRYSVDIGTRILILAAVLRRLALEDAPVDNGFDVSAEAFDEREWLREQGLVGELTASEAALLDSPPGSIAPDAIGEASWQGEALVALGWAIGAVDMPPVGIVSDPRPVIDVVPRPWDGIKDWLDDQTVVLESDAVRQREVAEIWYWRLTTEVLRRTAPTADRHVYDEAIVDVAAEALEAGLVPVLHEGDYSVHGRSIRDLSGNVVDELIAVTGQRLHALNWLCGFGTSWDAVPLDI